MQKVAAYCRVSTDSADQANSLAGQETFFREYIKRNPGWELAQVFVDTGITGTSTRKRTAFNRMITEAMSGSFSLILTKEISRFARNTLDSIYYTRKLKERGVGVIFLNDNINTLDPDAELRLTIMSSIAQEESRKTSDRVKWGQKRRMEQGVVFGRDMLGYDVRDGRLYVNEEGAEIVRLIFHKYVHEKKGAHVIARELREAGIPTSTYMKQWSNTVILRVLRNEKYCGDLIQKKTITPSYLNHEKKYNRGEEELVVLRDHHEPIVSRELFDGAQKELKRRSPSPVARARHSNRYCFSGKIKCGLCGSSFVSRSRKRRDGSVYKAWRCYQAAVHGGVRTGPDGERTGCCCPSIREETLRAVLQSILQSLPFDRTSLLHTVETAVAAVRQAERQTDGTVDFEERKKALLVKKQRLIELYLSGEIDRTEFGRIKEKYDRELELAEQEEKRGGPHPVPAGRQITEQSMHTFLTGLTEGRIWDEIYYGSLLAGMTVSGDDTITISLYGLSCRWQAVPSNCADHRMQQNPCK